MDTKRAYTRNETFLFHYLTGYGKGRPDALRSIIAYDNCWHDCARAEMMRRMQDILTLCDDEILAAIASGSLDIRRIAQDVLESQ